MAKGPVSLKAIAAHLGLTVGTVSRAMNGYPDIAKSTRDRVMEAARELGYRPNNAARSLSTGVTEVVAYIMPEQTSSLSEPFIAELLKGLGETLRKRGWDLMVTHTTSVQDELEQIDRLWNTGVVGAIVISRPLKKDPRIPLMQKLGCPFVVHGRSEADAPFAWYDVDGYEAFMAAVGHLTGLGHRHIAFVGSPLQYEFAQSRLDGYLQGLKVNGLTHDPDLIQIADISDAGGERATRQLLDLPKPPTAILAVTDTVALGVLAAIRTAGLTPGPDISVIGYDGLHFGVHTNPPLTSMEQPRAHAGRRIAEMIFNLLDGADPKDVQELQRAHLVSRSTDAPIKSTNTKQDNSVREKTQ
ncbi:MAG: substrate-binding domain-containing protein [Pseudomonadota bacterium]